VPIEDSVGAIHDLQREGKVRQIGVCNVTPTELTRAQQVAPIVSVQNHHNLVDRTHPEILDRCRSDGLAFLAYFPLGDSGDGNLPQLVHAGIGTPLAAVAARRGATPAQVALAWLVKTIPFCVPIPGTGSRAHLEENMAALPLAAELTGEDLGLLATVETRAGGY
jgi:pyridoxine 4-dehydrogenase